MPKNLQTKTDAPEDYALPIVEHLRELRTRLLRGIIATALTVLILSPFSAKLYTVFSAPMQNLLAGQSSMIAVEVASPFLTPFKLLLVLSLFIVAPYWLHQIWAFIAPGMYQNEKRITALMILGGTMLFYAGALFAWSVVLPATFLFFHSVAPIGVTIMTDIRQYLSFVLKIIFAFGIAFQIPILVIASVSAKIVQVEQLARSRPYVIIFCFFMGMILTPPDVISQILLAMPAWFLFEVGLLLARYLQPK